MSLSGHASRTALVAAALRAVHQLVDDEPRILEDPVVPRLLDAKTLEEIRTHPSRFRTPALNALRVHIVTRSRWAEDRLAEACRRGVRQYAILGAGLDTFAYRQPPWAGALRIFEVDHPASQRAKRERLAAAGIVLPPNIVFVAHDLEAGSLRDDLSAAGFDAGAATFLSCLGVTMYLSAEAVDAVLAFAAVLRKGSELALTFAAPDSSPALAERAAAVGETWKTRVAPDALARRLAALGFSAIDFLTPDEAARYLQGRRDDLRPPKHVHFVSATV